MNQTTKSILLLGTGNLGRAIVRRNDGKRKLIATTRNPNRIFELANMGVEPLIMPLASADLVEPLATNNYVVVSFPPDGSTDRILAAACQKAAALVYISSTAVYGNFSGTVDDTTPVDRQDERAQKRLEAEALWQEAGAVVLRAPGLYGDDYGLHRRLLDGSFRLPEQGQRIVSRIHIDDLAKIVLACLESELRGETFVVGDSSPVPLVTVVQWLCERLNLPLPDEAPLDEVGPTLRNNRAVDGRKILDRLSLTLDYPSFKEGYAASIERLVSTSGRADP